MAKLHVFEAVHDRDKNTRYCGYKRHNAEGNANGFGHVADDARRRVGEGV
jgi:hypothetical protein